MLAGPDQYLQRPLAIPVSTHRSGPTVIPPSLPIGKISRRRSSSRRSDRRAWGKASGEPEFGDPVDRLSGTGRLGPSTPLSLLAEFRRKNSPSTPRCPFVRGEGERLRKTRMAVARSLRLLTVKLIPACVRISVMSSVTKSSCFSAKDRQITDPAGTI